MVHFIAGFIIGTLAVIGYAVMFGGIPITLTIQSEDEEGAEE